MTIFDHDIEEDLKVCSYNSVNYIADLGGLTGLFTGCSIISLLELAFILVVKYRMKMTKAKILDISISGFCLKGSVKKWIRFVWFSIFLLLACGLGFYIYEIVRKYQVDPPTSEEIGQVLKRNLPFPAITVCTPYFARNQTANLSKFLRDPNQKLSVKEQNQMAANVQACAPHLGSILSGSCSMADNAQIIDILKSRDMSVNESFQQCGVGGYEVSCIKMFNYVLTDNGYCFTYNTEEFSSIFNSKIISDDFKCYSKQSGRRNYQNNIFEPNETSNVTNEREWSLERGYQNNFKYVFPNRAIRSEILTISMAIRKSDALNLCPENGIFHSLYFHMPNEIMTPLHVPEYLFGSRDLTIDATYHQIDESLRHYAPDKRDCYFNGEKQLSFFKSYTKALCEFECMANYTFDECGCVKFSMPRQNLTPICSLNQTSCYVKTMKEWNKSAKKCACLHSCTYIEYSIKNDRSDFEEIVTFP